MISEQKYKELSKKENPTNEEYLDCVIYAIGTSDLYLERMRYRYHEPNWSREDCMAYFEECKKIPVPEDWDKFSQ